MSSHCAGFGAARAPLGVVGGDAAGGGEQLIGDDPGAVDRDPFVAVAGDLPVAAGGAPVGHRFGAVVVDPADVGLVAQQPADRGVAPGGLAGRRRYRVGVEPATDLAHGDAGGAVGEDPPHHRGLGLVDLVVCLAGGGAAGDAAVAVGSLPGDDLAGAGPKQFAAPVAFGDLGLLVFGDHALHLGEQYRLRVVGGQPRGVGERDGDPEAVQLVEHQHLVGVGAGEPVRRQAPHPFDEPGLGGITQCVQAGAVQSGAGMPVVDVLADQLVTGGGDVFAQQRQLRADGAAVGLALGGHPRIQRRPHRSPRSDCIGGQSRSAARSSRNS